MPGFSTEVPHTLGREAALEKLKGFADKVREKYKDQVSSMTGEWHDNVLKFAMTTYGFTISGVLTVEEQLAKLEATLPFAALAFRGKIEQSFAAEIKKALAS
ncbi:MAG TPA: polyhydroxyalkanoic acid system family protein [Pirellulaceae bacterium]|nr:polyhydroxyalkanoic acid system family protein [Pirellulaceae bacterium]